MSDATLPATRPAAALPANPAALFGRVKGLAAQPAVARSLPLLGAAAALALAFLAWMSFASGPQRDLFSGLGDADKAAVAEALSGANIKYTLDRATGALAVADGDYYRAKMLLAQAGLPKSAPDGDQLIASLPLGASRAVETERLRGAREQDLARTIEAIDAVESAKVHLAVEQPSVFVRDSTPATASVMLRLRSGRSLSDGQVRAIVNLVGSSVPGLSADSVSVVDQAGHLLSRNGGDAASDRQLELQQRMEQRYQEQVAKLLTPLVGADGFSVEVHTDLDFAETQATRESYPKDTSVVRQEQGGWENNAQAGQTPGGIPGAIANQPPTTAQVTATPPAVTTPQGNPMQPGTTAAATAGKTSETYNRTYEIGHEVSVTKTPTGVVKRLSVAVALKQGAKPRGVAELAQLEQLVKGAVGFDQARGDQFAMTSRAFVAEEAPAPPKWYEASWIGLIGRNLAGPVIALLAFFGVVRPLMKKRAAAIAAVAAADLASPSTTNPALGGQIAAALAEQAAGNPGQTVTLDMIEAAPGYADRAQLIRTFVRQDPDRAALVVRDLIRGDMAGSAANG